MFNTGQQIGPYKLIKLLGRGGFGEVWLAERRTELLTTKVAVKLPVRNSIDLETVKQEAVLWGHASGHPNILPIIEANIYNGQILFVSEYAPDGSLADLLKQSGKLSPEKSVEIMSGILSGLEFLHTRKIIHRDLKPANVLLQGNTPRLADFGISRALRTTQASSTQTIAGTFEFMAPEAFDGKRNVQTDIWSAGVTLYKLLTNRLPFPQSDPTALIGAILTSEPEPLPDSIPANLRNVVLRALSKNPFERYDSASRMRETLLNSFKRPATKSNFEFTTFKMYETSEVEPETQSKSHEPPKPSLIKRMLNHFAWASAIIFLMTILAASMSWYILKTGNRNGAITNSQNINMPETQSSPAPILNIPPQPTIREVNFKKTVFPLSQELKDSGITQKDLKIQNISYGDLDGDGKEEAAVLIMWSFGRSEGTGYGFLCYVFDMKNMSLGVISTFDLGGRDSQNLWNMKQSIQKSQLVLTGCYIEETGSYLLTRRYKIVNNELTLISQKQIEKECQ